MKRILLVCAICTAFCISQTTLFGDDASRIFGTTATGALLGGAFGGGRGAAIGAGVGAGVGLMSTAAERDRRNSRRRSADNREQNLRRELRDLEARRDEIQEELGHVKNAKRRQRLENELDDVTHDIRDIRRMMRMR